MAVMIKCKMCGGDLHITEGSTVCECEYCGTRQTVPTLDNEKKLTLFSRAGRLLRNCEFDKASGIFESIVAEFPEEAEAYWGLVLCKYGIEYVDDPNTGKKIPTCHRSSFESVLEDPNFEQACENTDAVARRVYRDEARQLEELRKSIIEVSGKEEPYDIFISYKETDENGNRTLDSVIAQDIYTELTEKGYRVFFSRISLEDKLGVEYEPYIFAALNSAKVMVVVGTDYENFDAVWVKNEWSRFLKLIANGQKKVLIPVFKNMDPYDMPKEFSKLAAQDMGKVGAMQDLVRGIGKLIETRSSSNARFTNFSNPEASVLVQRGNLALEDGDFDGAERFFERALDSNPAEAYAYLGKCLASLGVSSLEDMKERAYPLDDNREFKHAAKFADPVLANKLREIKDNNKLNIERLRLKEILQQIVINRAMLESLQLLTRCTHEDYDKANRLVDSLVSNNCISKSKGYEYKKKLEREFFVLTYLYQCLEPRSQADIFSAANSARILFKTEILEELVKEKLIVKQRATDYRSYNSYDTYCWPNANEEKARRRHEEEKRKQRKIRQKAAFDAACAEVNAKAKKELSLKVADIEEQFSPKYYSIQQKISKTIADADKQRELIQGIISDLWRKQSSLGIFKGKEKKALQEQINEQSAHLETIPSSTDIQKQFQPTIDQINLEKQIEIETATAEIYSKYVLPSLEDFTDI